MITNNDLNKQLPNELNVIFKELKVLQHLRNAGITKALGFSRPLKKSDCPENENPIKTHSQKRVILANKVVGTMLIINVFTYESGRKNFPDFQIQILSHFFSGLGFSSGYLFQLVFGLIFRNKNWFRTLESKKSHDFPAKDSVYRFMNHSTFNWRKFLLNLSSYTIGKVTKLTNHQRPKVLILDDSSYDRNRSKSVELLARCFDHASQKMRYYKGFRLLTLGWSDGATFIPVDFSLLSSKKSQINGISPNIDKRSSGYKRRVNALQTAPEQIPDMIHRALSSGIDASYVLMDSWFTTPPLVKNIQEQGLDVIGMVKNLKQRYLYDDQRVSLKELYTLATPTEGKKSIIRSIHTTQSNGVVVCQHKTVQLF